MAHLPFKNPVTNLIEYIKATGDGTTGTPYLPERSLSADPMGLNADAAVKSATATGSISAKLRGLVEMLFDVWDDTANSLRVTATVTTSPIGGALSTPVAVSVTTTATLLLAANASRRAIVIDNGELSTTVYLGGSGVTTATGLILWAGESKRINTVSAIYGRVVTGTADVRVAEEV